MTSVLCPLALRQHGATLHVAVAKQRNGEPIDFSTLGYVNVPDTEDTWDDYFEEQEREFADEMNGD